MLLNLRTQRSPDLTAFELRFQLGDGRDIQLLIDPQNTFRVEPGILPDRFQFGPDLSAQAVELPERSALNDFPDGAADGFTDAGIFRDVLIVPDGLFDAVAKSLYRPGRPQISFNLEPVLSLRGQKLREPQQLIRDFVITYNLTIE
jgi:hypothetical protein